MPRPFSPDVVTLGSAAAGRTWFLLTYEREDDRSLLSSRCPDQEGPCPTACDQVQQHRRTISAASPGVGVTRQGHCAGQVRGTRGRAARAGQR